MISSARLALLDDMRIEIVVIFLGDLTFQFLYIFRMVLGREGTDGLPIP